MLTKLKCFSLSGLMILLLSGTTQAIAAGFSDPCSNLTKRMQKLTLKELVKRSDYIGIYRADEGELSKEQIFERSITYTYYLSTTGTDLKGDGPRSLILKGHKPIEKTTPFHFTVFRAHDAINPEHVGNIGSNWPEKLKKEDKCVFSPVYMKGYEYLIFSFDSGISYETIFSPLYDNWYKMVEEEVKKQNKGEKQNSSLK